MSSEDAAEIMREGDEMAKAGNERLVKLFIERMLPKHRPVQIDLPGISFASDAVDAHSAIIEGITVGLLSPSEGAANCAARHRKHLLDRSIPAVRQKRSKELLR